MQSIRVLLVDDNPEFVASITNFIASEPIVNLVGQANSGHEALVQIVSLRPELVLIDDGMPDMSGIALVRRIKLWTQAPRTVLLTLFNQAGYKDYALAAGADGVLAKVDIKTKLLPLIFVLFGKRIMRFSPRGLYPAREAFSGSSIAGPHPNHFLPPKN